MANWKKVEDQILWEKFQAGDMDPADYGARMVERWQGYVHTYLRNTGIQNEDSRYDDVLSDMNLAVLLACMPKSEKNPRGYDGTGILSRWVKKSIRNAWSQAWDEIARQQRTDAAVAIVIGKRTADTRLATGYLDSLIPLINRYRPVLHFSLRQEGIADIAAWRWYDGLTWAEVGEQLGCHGTTASRRFQKGMLRVIEEVMVRAIGAGDMPEEADSNKNVIRIYDGWERTERDWAQARPGDRPWEFWEAIEETEQNLLTGGGRRVGPRRSLSQIEDV